MKGGGAVVAAGKRRWRGLVVGVLGLVILSMLVPLGFLLGRFHSASTAAFVSDQPSSTSNDLRTYDKHGVGIPQNQSESQKDKSSHVEELIEKLRPPISKDVLRDIADGAKNHNISEITKHSDEQEKGVPMSPHGVLQPVSSSDVTDVGRSVERGRPNRRTSFFADNTCQWRFGSYCLWREEHWEDMKDAMVKILKDRLFVARAYFPSIAKLPTQEQLSRELRLNIQDFERVLGESSRDVDLPPQIEKKLQRMEAAIAKSKTFKVECTNVDKKLAQILDLTEDEANFHMKQSAFLYQVAVKTMPKSLHCLSMRLTVEYFTSSAPDMELSLAKKFSDPTLQHFVIFSNNVLASSVVINSTVMSAHETGNLVFHVLTDEENYFAMKLWFLRHAYKQAAVEVLNVQRLAMNLNDKMAFSSFSMSKEFRVYFHGGMDKSALDSRTEYISIFSNLHYLLPEIFQDLKKIVVLEDDIIVQRDLSALWNLNMDGKVNGAAQFCSVRLGQLRSFLRGTHLEKDACVWMSGLNIIDLTHWRELKLTQTYQKLVQELTFGGSGEASLLRASLLTFQNLIKPLEEWWILPGLGHDYRLDNEAMKHYAVLHYNGNMKPWLDMAIPKYRAYWKTFLSWDDQILSDCNINP